MRAGEDGFRRRLEALAQALPALERGDEEGLHRARVAARRLREVVPLLGLSAKASAKLGRRLRWLSRRAGPLRELDVVVHLLQKLEGRPGCSAAALALAQGHVARARDRQRRRLAQRLPPQKLQRLLTRLGEAHARPWPPDELEARLARRARRLRRALERAAETPTPERLHRVRHEARRLRYSMELVGGQERPLELLRSTQEVLGELHDRTVLLETLGQVAVPRAARSEFAQLERVVEADSRRLAARFAVLRPRLLALSRSLSPR